MGKITDIEIRNWIKAESGLKAAAWGMVYICAFGKTIRFLPGVTDTAS
jgi:hypothetical protein